MLARFEKVSKHSAQQVLWRLGSKVACVCDCGDIPSDLVILMTHVVVGRTAPVSAHVQGYALHVVG